MKRVSEQVARDRLLDAWAVQGAAQTTVRQRLRLLDKVGGVHASDEQVMAYVVTVAHPSTRRTTVTTLRTVFRWCVRLGIRSDDPTLLVPMPRPPRSHPSGMSPAEVRTLETGLTGVNRDRFILALYAGLRACELAAIEGKWLRWTEQGPMLRVLGKGGTDLLVPAHPKVVAVLESAPKGRLWDVDAKLLAKQMKRAMNRLGVPGGPHRLRHTFAMRVFAAANGDLMVVRDLLRHTSVATTQVYVSCLPTAQRQVLESIA